MHRSTPVAIRPVSPSLLFLHAFSLLVAALFFVSAGAAQAGTLTVPVGREATWLHLPTGERRLDGRRLGVIELDRRRIEARCRALDPDFAGYTRLTPIRSAVRPIRVRVECLAGAPQPTSTAQSGEAELAADAKRS